jgi:hypothetical protein
MELGHSSLPFLTQLGAKLGLLHDAVLSAEAFCQIIFQISGSCFFCSAVQGTERGSVVGRASRLRRAGGIAAYFSPHLNG